MLLEGFSGTDGMCTQLIIVLCTQFYFLFS